MDATGTALPEGLRYQWTVLDAHQTPLSGDRLLWDVEDPFDGHDPGLVVAEVHMALREGGRVYRRIVGLWEEVWPEK